MNLGVYLRRLGDETAPPEHRCHIRARLDRVVENVSLLVEALDLDSRLSDSERQESVISAIVQSGLPWLEARETEAKARCALLTEKNPAGLVMAAARRHLGIVDPA